MALPKPGIYQATTGGNAPVVYEAESGSLCLALPVTLQNSEPPWSGKTTLTLVKNDGTTQTRNLATLREIFPEWDGNPFTFDNVDTTDKPFEVTAEHEEYTDRNGEQKVGFKIKWVNPIGVGIKMPEKPSGAELERLMKKWGGKFTALAAPAVKPAEKPADPDWSVSRKAVKKPAPVVEKPAPRTQTMDEVWDALVLWNKEQSSPMTEDELAQKKLYPACDAVVGQAVADPSTLTPEQWGKVAEKLGL